jgi:hypothetical protein
LPGFVPYIARTDPSDAASEDVNTHGV